MLRIVNPATEALLQDLPADDEAAVRAKYARARAAQPAWQATPIEERTACIAHFADALNADVESLASVLTDEMGKPLQQARSEIIATGERLRFFMEQAPGALLDEHVHSEPGLREVITQEPLGVVGNISAWNYPYFVGTNVIVPALLMGNAVLYKPSEFTSLTGLCMDRLLHEAGVPEDVFTSVIGSGETGAALLQQPLDAVCFTGSYATGAKVARAAAEHLMKVQLELGGKDPAYVCEDADAATAAASLADGAFYNTGQSCCAVERLYVHGGIYDGFVEAFLDTVQGFAMGNPRDDGVYIGPLTRPAQRDVLARQIADATERGAEALCGGKAVDGPGYFFQPTVLVNVNHDMAVMREESFGPIIGIQRVADDAEAVALMRDTEYGLTAGVYTPARDRAERILGAMDTGTVYWNCCDRVSPRLPWSGRRHSGIGSTLSVEGIKTFLRPKAWHLKD